jgi:hypothetical protein
MSVILREPQATEESLHTRCFALYENVAPAPRRRSNRRGRRFYILILRCDLLVIMLRSA